MSRALLVIANDAIRAKAVRWVTIAPKDTRIEFKGPKRTLPQNDCMWRNLTKISEQLTWHGQKYSPDDWKDYLMHALRRARWMPDEDGGMVPVGMRTSDRSIPEMGEMIELTYAFGARHGVDFDDSQQSTARERPAATSAVGDQTQRARA